MKLMIVEENPGLRRLLHTLLEPSSAEISECTEGSAAVSLSALEAPDWIVLDLNLARANGLQVLRGMHVACPQARIVLLADEAGSALRLQAEQAGAAQLVLKDNLLVLPAVVAGQVELKP